METGMKHDFETQEQAEAFYKFLEATSEHRQKFRNAFAHNELEWEAFQAGWNAAKQQFGVTE